MNPEDGQLFVDNLLYPLFGASPAVELSPGPHTFAFERPGYAEADLKIVVPSDHPAPPVEVSLTPLPAVLHIETTPPGANIRIGGLALGKAPVSTRKLVPGETYTLTVEAPGLQPVSTPVKLKPGEEKTISVRLTTSPAEVSTSTPQPSPGVYHRI
jgi:hypothetical protein